jgi:hypothetical protein
VRRGGTLVIVHCDDKNARRVADIFRGLPSVDINRRMARWGTSGFKGYDEKASFYSDEDITRERELGRSELHVPVIEETIAVGQAKVFETIRDTTKKTEVEVKPIAGEARTSRSSLDRMSAERVSRSSQI